MRVRVAAVATGELVLVRANTRYRPAIAAGIAPLAQPVLNAEPE